MDRKAKWRIPENDIRKSFDASRDNSRRLLDQIYYYLSISLYFKITSQSAMHLESSSTYLTHNNYYHCY